MSDLFDRLNTEREVDGWLLRSDIPVAHDKQERHHAKAQRPAFPFQHMREGECFDVHPRQVGEEDILRAANIVSSAASSFKYKSRQGDQITRDFKTAQVGGRFVRCWRIL